MELLPTSRHFKNLLMLTMVGANSMSLLPALLAGPPTLSLIYEVVAVIFISVWGEETKNKKIGVGFRIAMVGAFLAIALETPLTRPLVVVLIVMSCTVSGYCLLRTRRDVVEGGAIPVCLITSTSTPVSIQGDDQGGSQIVLAGNNVVQQSIVVLITGSNTGIGKETARYLASLPSMGASTGTMTIVLACRSRDKAADAVRDIMQTCTNNLQSVLFETVQLDLSSLESVRLAAAEVRNRHNVIDMLINNAGLMMDQRITTKDGYELVMQANHLGHYLWTWLLLPQILKSKHPRIINVTSSTYKLTSSTPYPFEDMFCHSRRYDLFTQYAWSKLANIYFTQELARRYSSIYCAAVHPGLVRTDVVRNMPWYLRYPNVAFGWILASLQKTPRQGAWCTLHVALTNREQLVQGDDISSSAPSGSYWVNREPQKLQRKRSDASEEAKRLWDLSAQLVGVDIVSNKEEQVTSRSTH